MHYFVLVLIATHNPGHAMGLNVQHIFTDKEECITSLSYLIGISRKGLGDDWLVKGECLEGNLK